MLAFRGTLYSSQRDGYVELDNLGEDVHDKDRWDGRLQARITPTDTLSIRVIGDYTKIDEACCAGIQLLDNIAATDRNNPYGSPVPGTDNILSGLGGTTGRGDLTGSYATQVNLVPTSSLEDAGLSVDVNWDFNDYATLTSITGYRLYDSDVSSDNDFTDVDILAGASGLEVSSFSQEFRVSYSAEKTNAIAIKVSNNQQGVKLWVSPSGLLDSSHSFLITSGWFMQLHFN